MKWRMFFVSLLTCFGLLVHAQYPLDNKRDYVWLFGYSDGNHYQRSFGISQIQYEDTSSTISVIDSFGHSFEMAEGVACDTNGNLLFSSNGIFLYDKNFGRMPGVDTLAPGPFSEEWAAEGLPIPQGVLVLPSPGYPNIYTIIHVQTSNRYDSIGLYQVTTINHTEVDAHLNNGNGEVIFYPEPIITNVGDLAWGEITACRHANGRDWWIIICNSTLNKYRRILLNENGFHDMGWESTGLNPLQYVGVGQAAFTPDGTKYVMFNTISGSIGNYLDCYDFDRCTGLLSNAHRFRNREDCESFGLAVAPNSRFVYVSCFTQLEQYDLWQEDSILMGKQIVATYDTFVDPDFTLGSTTFCLMGNTPDGKIIVNTCPPTTHYLHVIDFPNEQGPACHVRQHCVELPSFNSYSMANYPNFRLGPLSGSACDTLTGLSEEVRTEKEKILKVFPNPASDYVVIDYGFTDWNKGAVSLEIQNQLGQTVYLQQLPMYSGYQKMDVNGYVPGLYVVQIKRGNMLVAMGKFVRE